MYLEVLEKAFAEGLSKCASILNEKHMPSWERAERNMTHGEQWGDVKYLQSQLHPKGSKGWEKDRADALKGEYTPTPLVKGVKERSAHISPYLMSEVHSTEFRKAFMDHHGLGIGPGDTFVAG